MVPCWDHWFCGEGGWRTHSWSPQVSLTSSNLWNMRMLICWQGTRLCPWGSVILQLWLWPFLNDVGMGKLWQQHKDHPRDCVHQHLDIKYRILWHIIIISVFSMKYLQSCNGQYSTSLKVTLNFEAEFSPCIICYSLSFTFKVICPLKVSQLDDLMNCAIT